MSTDKLMETLNNIQTAKYRDAMTESTIVPEVAMEVQRESLASGKSPATTQHSQVTIKHVNSPSSTSGQIVQTLHFAGSDNNQQSHFLDPTVVIKLEKRSRDEPSSAHSSTKKAKADSPPKV